MNKKLLCYLLVALVITLLIGFVLSLINISDLNIGGFVLLLFVPTVCFTNALLLWRINKLEHMIKDLKNKQDNNDN